MTSFALITEGLTDQVTISSILTGHYGEEPDISEAQPLRDATDESRQGSFAGWEKVFSYCKSELFLQQFYANDFVVIQIDTDVCGHKNFNVNLKLGNKDRPTADIIEDVKDHIIKNISREIYDKYKDRIIFAISIHSLECWILPLYGKTKIEKGRTRKCEDFLRDIIKRFDIQYEKTFDPYLEITKPFRTKKYLDHAVSCNQSLQYFIKSLPPA